jgi:mRNA interferase HigB
LGDQHALASGREKEDMHVIAKSTLLGFADKHPESRDKLLSWHKTMKACTAKNFSELKLTFTSADYVPKKYTVFDIGGNDYRIVTVILYHAQKVYVRLVGTHAEYDKWTKENRGK